MREKKHIVLLLLIIPLFLTIAEAKEEQGTNYTELLGKTLNFVVLFGGLAYFLFKPLRRFLEKRAKKIDHSLKEAEDSRQEAEKKLEKVKARLSRIEEEIMNIKKEGEDGGRREKERIIKEAQGEAERIRRFAKEEIEMFTRAGIRELKEYTAELATALALERIKRKMTDEDQSVFIDKAINKIEGLYEKSDSDKEIRSRAS